MNRFVAWLKAKALAWSIDPSTHVCVEREAVDQLQKACLSAQENCRVLAASLANAEACLEFPVVEHDEPKWTPDDGDTWRHFLATNGAGQKLQSLANYHEQACNRNAILRKEGAENNTGFARGWHMATAYFFKTLSAEVRPEQDPNDTQQGDSASQLRERVAP